MHPTQETQTKPITIHLLLFRRTAGELQLWQNILISILINLHKCEPLAQSLLSVILLVLPSVLLSKPHCLLARLIKWGMEVLSISGLRSSVLSFNLNWVQRVFPPFLTALFPMSVWLVGLILHCWSYNSGSCMCWARAL